MKTDRHSRPVIPPSVLYTHIQTPIPKQYICTWFKRNFKCGNNNEYKKEFNILEQNTGSNTICIYVPITYTQWLQYTDCRHHRCRLYSSHACFSIRIVFIMVNLVVEALWTFICKNNFKKNDYFCKF